MLEAAQLGIGSTWVMYFKPDAVRTEFKLPESVEPVALLVMDIRLPTHSPPPMHAQIRPLNELVVYNAF